MLQYTHRATRVPKSPMAETQSLLATAASLTNKPSLREEGSAAASGEAVLSQAGISPFSSVGDAVGSCSGSSDPVTCQCHTPGSQEGLKAAATALPAPPTLLWESQCNGRCFGSAFSAG